MTDYLDMTDDNFIIVLKYKKYKPCLYILYLCF